MPYGQTNIVLVEDNDILRIGYVRYLEDQGLSVLAADSVRSGLLKIQEANPPHVVVVDYDMPGGNGDQLIKQARDLGYANVPFIIFSGDTWGVAEQNAIDLGVKFLPKSQGVVQLLWLINELLPEDRKVY